MIRRFPEGLLVLFVWFAFLRNLCNKERESYTSTIMHSRILLGILLSIFPFCAAFGQAPKKAKEIKTTGVFSDMFISRESGDVGGIELFFFNGEKDYVVISKAEGQLQEPQISEVEQNGNNVQFAMRSTNMDSKPVLLKFSGIFSANKLTGKFSNGNALSLPRKKPMFMTTYSDMAHIPERGKVVGLEIIKFLADKQYVLVIQGRQQMAFGEASYQGNTLQFALKKPDGSTLSFKGTTNKTSLTGTLVEDGQPSTIKLPEKKSFWE